MDNSSPNITNNTDSNNNAVIIIDPLIGYASLLISCAAFGFMFAPLKRLDARDGVFVQWVQCSVVFMAGFVINIVRGLPSFNLIASIGGFLYATGNVASVPIVAEMGIGLGMLIWGSVQIIVGWCVAHFGLFGTKAQSVQSPLLNYLGVLLTLFSGLMFVFVYGEEEEQIGGSDAKEEDESNPRGRVSANVPLNVDGTNRRNGTGGGTQQIENADIGPYGSVSQNVWAAENQQQQQQSAVAAADHNRNATLKKETTTGAENRVSNNGFQASEMNVGLSSWRAFGRSVHLTKRKLFFIGLSVGLGSLHGLMLTPIVYVQDTDPNTSKNVLDYVFSHFSAVFFFSTLYFLLYSFIKQGKPFVQARLVLPAVAYGILWTIGMTLFIVSNRLLSQTVSFPITVRLPAIIGALADVLLFKSVKGKQSLYSLFIAILIGSIGVILVGISLY